MSRGSLTYAHAGVELKMETMSPNEIKAAINGAEAHRHRAWQVGDARTAADLAVQIDLLWDAWRGALRPYHTAEGSTRARLPGYKIFNRKAVHAG